MTENAECTNVAWTDLAELPKKSDSAGSFETEREGSRMNACKPFEQKNERFLDASVVVVTFFPLYHNWSL
jgi:hypothetical protein